MAILGIVGSLMPSIANLALISIPINEAKIAFNRMYEFASIEKEKEEGVSISEINSITIQDLSFRFAGRSELFKNINLNIEKGVEAGKVLLDRFCNDFIILKMVQLY